MIRMMLIGGWAAVLFGIPACSKEKNFQPPETGVNRVHAVGYIEPEGKLRRLSFEGTGVIFEITVEIGDDVEEGSILGRLGAREQMAMRDQRQAELHRAETELARLLAGMHPDKIRAMRAGVNEAEANAAYRDAESVRLGGLFAEDGISRKELELAKHEQRAAAAQAARARAILEEGLKIVRPEDKDMAEAEVEVRKAALGVAEEMLGQRVLHAPSDGRVLEIFRREGEREAGEAVMLFAPEGAVLVRAEVDEGFVGLIHESQRVEIGLPGSSARTIEGKVIRIKSVMGDRSVFSRDAHERLDIQVFEIFVELEDAEQDLPHGLEVSVKIETEGTR